MARFTQCQTFAKGCQPWVSCLSTIPQTGHSVKAKRETIRTRPASLAEVAKAAGVSISTVSRIVNGETRRASTETVERVKAVVADLGYRANVAGRSLRSGDSRIVAMLAPNIDNPAMAAIASSTEAALRRAGYVMILCDTHDRPDLQDEYLRAMRAQAAQGYVMVSSVRSRELEAAVARGEPIVFVSRRSPYGDPAYVGVDNLQAGRDAANLLLSRGVERPAALRPEIMSNTIADRLEGFREALIGSGVAARDISIAAGAGASHLDFGYAAARALTSERGWPQGLMCPSDLMAYGAYRLATEQGVAIPATCRLVGVDDNPLNEWIAPWLSSIRIPYRDFGEPVLNALTALWSGGPAAEILLPHEPVAR